MKPFVEDVTGIDMAQAFLGVKHMLYSIWLDSNDPGHEKSRYSYIVCKPIETIEAKDELITVTNWEQKLSFKEAPFKILQSRIESWIPEAEHIDGLPPFQGGAVGLFGYDLGHYVENIPRERERHSQVADMAVGIYDQVLAHDHLENRTFMITHARDAREATVKKDFLLDIYRRPYEVARYHPSPLDWSSNFTQKTYQNAVQRVIDYIYEGDIFQANLSQRFDAELPRGFDPIAHYMHMRTLNPVPYGAYMNIGAVKIASASPESFLTVNGKHVVTSPIKGTRPRFDDPAHDQSSAQDLQGSEKDKAENTMIVDLMRNDLSRVCKAETIEVSKLCGLESFSKVHHLVSHIEAELEDNKTALDLMRACFPGGSITGAPKVRAMEIIEELEGISRGPYCGSVGYIGFDGVMDSSILIRTLVYEQNRVSLSVGGGIVADSNPEAEYRETLDKAQGVMRSFEIKDTLSEVS